MSKKLSTKLAEELNLVKESILKQVISKIDSLDDPFDVRATNISNSYEELLKFSFFFDNKRYFLDGITKEDEGWIVWFSEASQEYFELTGTTEQDQKRLDVLLSELETFGFLVNDLSSEDLITTLSAIEECEISLN